MKMPSHHHINHKINANLKKDRDCDCDLFTNQRLFQMNKKCKVFEPE